MCKHIIILCMALLAATGLRAEEVATDASARFVSVNLHLTGGLAYTTNNYVKCFPEISDLNSSVGPAIGIGVEGAMRLGARWSVGTALNITRSSRRMDMAVSVAGAQSVSNVFQSNHYYQIDVPVFMRWNHSIADGVRWNIDMGLYYAYGLGGKQKNTIYDAKTNDLGQLITSKSELEAGYYTDSDAFINSYRRADIGLHLGIGLTFRGHITVGVRSHLGVKDVAHSQGIVNPSAHNVDMVGVIGWTF